MGVFAPNVAEMKKRFQNEDDDAEMICSNGKTEDSLSGNSCRRNETKVPTLK